MGKIIIAPERLDVDGPVVFLAGPIQGSNSWHKEAMAHLSPHVHVASPKRPWNIYKDFSETLYNEQVDWETYFLRRAAQHRVVLFWLAKEKEQDHRCERAYAQTTRFELAEWKEYHRRDRIPLVVGIEDGFTGARYIRRRFSQDCPEIQICSSLEDTCRSAIHLLPQSQGIA